MIFSSKLTTGLAWTGLAVVLAVPAADFLTNGLGKGSQQAAVLTSTTDPVQTGSINKSAAVDPVDDLVKAGKPLPSYISDGATTTKTVSSKPGAPAVTVSSGKSGLSIAPVPATPDAGTTSVATVEPATVTPPVPFPARPTVIDTTTAEPQLSPTVATADPSTTTPAAAPVVTVTPRTTAAAPEATTPNPVVPAQTTTPSTRVANTNSDLAIVDDNGVASSRTTAAPIVVPPRTATVTPRKATTNDSMVDDSANWKSETLRQYLTKRGILEDMGDEGSTATVTESNSDDARYQRRRASIEQLLNQDDGYDSVGFSLF